MKLDNSNLFETLSQIRSGQYSAIYAAAAKKESPSVTDPADKPCLLYTSPSPRDLSTSRMPSSA